MISIILPTYNVQAYIARALQSCINQSFKDIEIIVVDDCGSDQSIDIAYSYARCDSRIKIIHNQRNIKLLQARHEGVKVAMGDYVMFLDSDDYLHPLICEKISNTLEKHKVDLLYYGMLVENIAGDFIPQTITQQSHAFSGLKEYYELILQSRECHWNLCNKVIKRELYLETLKDIDIEVNMAEDALVYFNLLFNTSSVYILGEEGYFYCKNDSSLMNNPQSTTQEHKEVLNLIAKKIRSIPDSHPHNPAFRRFAKVMLNDLKNHYRYRKIYHWQSIWHKSKDSFLYKLLFRALLLLNSLTHRTLRIMYRKL